MLEKRKRKKKKRNEKKKDKKEDNEWNEVGFLLCIALLPWV